MEPVFIYGGINFTCTLNSQFGQILYFCLVIFFTYSYVNLFLYMEGQSEILLCILCLIIFFTYSRVNLFLYMEVQS